MRKPYPVFRKDILSGKIFPREELIRLVKNGNTLILSEENLKGKGIYIHPSFLKSSTLLKKKLIRRGPETNFEELYQRLTEWKTK